jgi:hypothetical protein
LAGATVPARAVETEVNSTSAGQAYTLSSPWGGLTVKRRRFLETLALGLYHLEGGEPKPGGPDISVRLRLRLDADAGISSDETAYNAASDRFVPGLVLAPIDLMYAYVEGRNLAKGWLGFRLGRQYVTDSLGWWAFDGGLVRVTTPFFAEVELYGGLEERGGLPLSTPRFERNGVWRGDRKGIDDTVYTQFEKASIAPSYGVALQSTGVTWIHGRLDYRKVLNQGDSVVSLLVPDPITGLPVLAQGTRTSSNDSATRSTRAQRRSARSRRPRLRPLQQRAFDLLRPGRLVRRPPRHVGRRVRVLPPVVDGDSIFNYFAHSSMRTISGPSRSIRRIRSPRRKRGIRNFTTDGDPTTST